VVAEARTAARMRLMWSDSHRSASLTAEGKPGFASTAAGFLVKKPRRGGTGAQREFMTSVLADREPAAKKLS
jgi:hypothetical protein